MTSGVRGQPGRWLKPRCRQPHPSGSFSFESVDGLQSISTVPELHPGRAAALAGSNAVLTTALRHLDPDRPVAMPAAAPSYSHTLTGQVDNDSQSGASDSYTDSAVVDHRRRRLHCQWQPDVAINDDAERGERQQQRDRRRPAECHRQRTDQQRPKGQMAPGQHRRHPTGPYGTILNSDGSYTHTSTTTWRQCKG